MGTAVSNMDDNKNDSKNNTNDIKDEKEEEVDVPRYVINCSADSREPKFFESTSIYKLLRSVVKREKVFGYGFEVYGNDKGFETAEISFRGVKNHLIAALHYAFMHHLPFQLRPDDIWIIIAQGIAAHIAQNAEKLRKTFVDFDGKKEIEVRDDSLKINSQHNDWSFVLKQFDKGCRELTNNDIVNLMTCNFSTTSVATETASKCVLFKAMSEYINFSTNTMSGIPQISLVGSVDDWKKLEAKCKQLKAMNIGLVAWLKHLLPLIGNITETAEVLSRGKTLKKKLKCFWDSIYTFQSNSGGDAVSGWVKSLFPYDIHDKPNRELKWDYSADEYGEWAHMSPGDFPASYSRAPMIWNYLGKKKKCGMYGGIFGVAQQKDTGCIAPVIGWIIAGK